MTKAAVYAGTFDPITLGHFDLIERAADIFERLVLAIAVHSRKDCMFNVEERVAMARAVAEPIPNVEVTSFEGLLIDFARAKKISVLIRGIRAYSDFEYEFQMALTNRKLAPEMETLFMMPKEIHSYISSSSVREVAELGGDTSEFVPGAVQKYIDAKYGPRRN
ncbi:MAG: pantetheine-phosphate adenylyltransferase [Kiritimatiellae bacterium]|nr:pantetheine-phosphate adenylyltransferase [Kiritimatiellia bacterium]